MISLRQERRSSSPFLLSVLETYTILSSWLLLNVAKERSPSNTKSELNETTCIAGLL